MKVEMESNKSVKRIEMIEGNRASLNAPRMSSLKKTLLKSGRLRKFAGAFTRQRAQAVIVTTVIARRNANGLFRDIRKTEIASPRMVSSAGLPSAPSFTKVTG